MYKAGWEEWVSLAFGYWDLQKCGNGGSIAENEGRGGRASGGVGNEALMI